MRDKRSQFSALLDAGIVLLVDPVTGISHNKIMIFDGRYVLTRSFNFTRNAELRNAENILLIDDPSLAKIYTENWKKRAGQLVKRLKFSFKFPLFKTLLDSFLESIFFKFLQQIHGCFLRQFFLDTFQKF
ncbi:MAG: phospholipase D-like domain-containing protein [Holosporales bacterium]